MITYRSEGEGWKEDEDSDHLAYGIHEYDGLKCVWGAKIIVYGDGDLRDRIVQLLNAKDNPNELYPSDVEA